MGKKDDELYLRWVQLGVFSPVMRLHGSRIRHFEPTPGLLEPSGDPNEIWSFGEENFEILKDLILTREKLRPYIEQQMDIASEKGYPIMRPMFFEYPDDEFCYTLDSQYMFGDDIIFSPIVEEKQRAKTVYLPKGDWILTKDKKVYKEGMHYIKADVNEYIAFVKADSDVIKCFE